MSIIVETSKTVKLWFEILSYLLRFSCDTPSYLFNAELLYMLFIWSRLKKLASQTVWSVPEAATTVLCTADDGHDGRPRHVE